jgi:hypothetical protein
VAVVPAGAVAGGAARTRRSLTGETRSTGSAAAGGESTHAVAPVVASQSAGASASSASSSWRNPTTIRHRSGPANGAPPGPAGSVNSGSIASVCGPAAGA